MARWKPRSDEPVGQNEHVGRRLFDEPMLAGLQNHKKFAGLNLRNFEEKRDREFSLDRLGRTGIDKPVVNYLLPRANSAGEKFMPPLPFNGWAIIPARHLANPPVGKEHKLPVIASPIAGDQLGENIYHAHVLLPEPGSYSVALHLRHVFGTYGSVKAVELVQKPSWIWRFTPAWLRRRLSEH